jgi:hypothetical protein
MAGVRELMRKYERLKHNIPSIAESSVGEVKGDFVEAQKYQLEQGSTSTGGTFRKYRSSAYAKKKNQMNPLPGIGNPDLRLTGSFYRGISATVQSGVLKVSSSDPKAKILAANYDNNKIFGLNDEEMNDFVNGKVTPVFQKNIVDNLKQS